MRGIASLILVLIVNAPVEGNALAGGVFISSQERSVVTNVAVGVKTTRLVGSDSDFAAAPGKGHFEGAVDAHVTQGRFPALQSCLAIANQDSILLSHTFAVTGSAEVHGMGFPAHIGMTAQGLSIFTVKFSVYPGPVHYSLRTFLSAWDLLTGGDASVTVLLMRTTIGIDPSPPVHLDIEHYAAHPTEVEGILAPGSYTLSVVATASAMIDETGFAAQILQDAEYSLEVNFGTLPSADLNDDRVVDGADLVLLLDQWGSCASEGAMCLLADLDSDEQVNGGDLALLLGQWTLEGR